MARGKENRTEGVGYWIACWQLAASLKTGNLPSDEVLLKLCHLALSICLRSLERRVSQGGMNQKMLLGLNPSVFFVSFNVDLPESRRF